MRFPKSIRLPPEAYANSEAVFHVVTHTLPETSPFNSRELGDAIWKVIVGERDRRAVKLFAACLMPDHLHLLASPREKSIIRWMNDFKSFTTHISKSYRQQRFLWQPSYYDRRIRNEVEFEAVVNYILQNPVAARLNSAMEWPWVTSWVDRSG